MILTILGRPVQARRNKTLTRLGLLLAGALLAGCAYQPSGQLGQGSSIEQRFGALLVAVAAIEQSGDQQKAPGQDDQSDDCFHQTGSAS